VGSGGTLAHRLAPSGKRILLLERGDWLPREKDNWSSKAVFVDAKYRADETWHDKAGNAFHPGIQYCVGGKVKFYGAALLRLRSEDFGELRHHRGISPSWPLTYEDFEPYYTQVEELYQVHGQHGVDPTDPPASREYPYPPVTIEPRWRRCTTASELTAINLSRSRSGCCSKSATARPCPTAAASAATPATDFRVSSTASRTQRCSA
jgi:choline dehydrogenase-like flavoprotein